MWTVRSVLAATADLFAKRGIDEARLDAEHLLAHALGLRRIDLFVAHDRPLDEAELARYRVLVKERAGARLPVAYLTGRREFYSLELEVTRDVLVPRPETEGLVDAALEALARRPAAAGPALLADVGTGSGAIAIAFGKLAKPPAGRIFATDTSAAAIEVARRNVARHGLGDRIEMITRDLLSPLVAAGLAGKLAVLASNPPYIAAAERAALAPEVLAEPRLALFSGEDGLDALRAIVAGAPALLEPGGALVVEHGAAQGEATRALARAAGFTEVATRKDLAGQDRLLVARR